MNDLLAILFAAVRGFTSIMRDDVMMVADVVAPLHNKPPEYTSEDANRDLEQLYVDLTVGRTAEDDEWDAYMKKVSEDAGEFWCADLRDV